MPLVLLLIAYAVCVVMAALFVPSMRVFLLYGLPTWFGGWLFALLWERWRTLARA